MVTNAGRKEKRPAKRRADIEGANSSVGRALRSVYQEMVDETIPSDMLALLGKLE